MQTTCILERRGKVEYKCTGPECDCCCHYVIGSSRSISCFSWQLHLTGRKEVSSRANISSCWKIEIPIYYSYVTTVQCFFVETKIELYHDTYITRKPRNWCACVEWNWSFVRLKVFVYIDRSLIFEIIFNIICIHN